MSIWKQSSRNVSETWRRGPRNACQEFGGKVLEKRVRKMIYKVLTMCSRGWLVQREGEVRERRKSSS